MLSCRGRTDLLFAASAVVFFVSCPARILAAIPLQEWTLYDGVYFWADNSARMNYADAQLHCVNVGKAAGFEGHLASFHSLVEYETVHSNLRLMETGGVFDGLAAWYWIGLNDIDQEGVWVNTDGTPADFTDWAAGEPSAFFKDCASIGNEHLFSGNHWVANVCTSSQFPLCKFSTGTPKDWVLFDGAYFWASHLERLTFDEAESHCAQAGRDQSFLGHLASFQSRQEYAAIMAALPAAPVEGNNLTEINTVGNGLQNVTYWIGMNDKGLEDRFVYTDGSPANWFFWAPFEPSPGREEDCVALGRYDPNARDMWYDHLCTDLHFPLCKFRSTAPPTPWFAVEGGGLFWLDNSVKRNFADAEAHCKNVGDDAGFTGHLASFHSEAEYSSLVNSLPLKDTGVGIDANWYWLGLNDITLEGVWGYTDGSAVDWLNWAPGQPDNFQLQQHCAVMGKNHQTVQSMWLDMPCDVEFYSLCRFIR